MIRKTSFAALLFFLLGVDLFAQQAFHMELIGQLRTRGTSQYSNCWGYNAPNGREYAIVGTGLGTQIVDITTDTLKEIAFIPGPASSWREMKVYQHYAYVVTEGTGAGLQIIDLDSLKLVNTVTTSQVPSGHTISIEGKFLYINGSRYKNGGIVVLDLTDPVHPVTVGEYQTEYVHDCIIKNDTIYAAAIYGIGLDIIDATNKSDLKRISLVHYPFAGTHNADVTKDGKYVITTDEINNEPGQNGNVVRIWDKSDINNVKLTATYVAKPKTIAHNIHIREHYGYVAHYTEGVRVIDLKNPEIPVEVAYYDTYPGSANSTIGNWGVFPYFNSNKIIATDITGGLFVLRFSGKSNPIPVARGIITVLDSASGNPIEGASVELIGTSATFSTDANGKVKIGSLTDTVSVKISKEEFSSGYYPRIVPLTLSYDSTGAIVVKVQKLPVGGMTITVKESSSNDVIVGAKVQIANTTISGFTDGSGLYTVVQIIAEKSYRIFVSKFGYTIDSIDVVVQTNNTTDAIVSLPIKQNDDFMYDFGWTVGSVLDSGAAGRWIRAIPKPIILIGDTLQPPYGHGGQHDLCFVTGESNSLSDNVEGRTSLVSPTFSMAGMSNPTILYWVFTNTLSNPNDDTLYVEVSNDNGNSWIAGEIIAGKQKNWKQHKINTNQILPATAQMKIRFVARDGGTPSVFEVAVDDVEFGDNISMSVHNTPGQLPETFLLHQNYPNPFNPVTTIRYDIAERGNVSLKVYDIIGREIKTLVDTEQNSGYYSVQFNAEQFSSGVYFYTLRSGPYAVTKKLILSK